MLMALLLAALLLRQPGVARAQNGSCPPGTLPYYPANVWGGAVCLVPDNNWAIHTDEPELPGTIPCINQLLAMRLLIDPSRTRSFYIVPSADQTGYESGARIRFMWFSASGTYGGEIPDGVATVYYYDSGGGLNAAAGLSTANMTQVTTYVDDGLFPTLYTVYMADFPLQTTENSGFFKFVFNTEDAPFLEGYYVASMQAIPANGFLPEWCPIPNAIIPTTSTPTPTATPTGTVTPPAATPPLEPTYVPTIDNPTLTATPIIYPTLSAEATATPYPIPLLQPLTFPTLDIPAVPSLAVPPGITVTVSSSVTGAQERATLSWEMADAAVDIATRWAQPVTWGLTTFDVTGTLTTTISGSVPVSSTLTSFQTTISTIAYPIRFMRTIKDYMPNIWWLVTIMFSGLIVYIAIIVIKVAIAIISEVIEIIRRIWEAIPLN